MKKTKPKHSKKNLKNRIKYLKDEQKKEHSPYRQRNIEILREKLKKQEDKNG